MFGGLHLTNEQREAIETCKEKIIEPFYNFPNHTNHIFIDLKDTVVGAIETILSLIKEQKEEIEKYKALYERALSDLVKADKQIDLMAEMIDELSEYYTRYNGKNNEFCKEICIKKDIDCIDCIKQYFETKAKKGE